MKYTEAFDIAKAAITIRERTAGARYPQDAARSVALAMGDAVGTREALDRAVAALEAIERPFHSNPVWDGSIG